MDGFGGDRVPHKALLEIAGVPMLGRVLDTLEAAASIGRIAVSIDDAHVLQDLPTARGLLDAGRLAAHECGQSPADSVAKYLREETTAGRTVLVTTADHPLLSAANVDEFLSRVRENDLAVTAAMVSAQTFRARYPDLRRTFIPLRGEAYTGANLFAFRVPEGVPAAEFWRRVEAHRKTPWRMAALFGARTLTAFAMGRLDLEAAMQRISRSVGCTIGVVELSDPDVAIDVDSDEDARVVEQIINRRQAAGRG